MLDLGCGDGKLLLALADKAQIDRVTGVDVSVLALKIAKRRLKLDRRTERQKPFVALHQSALTYRDKKLLGFDVACLIEVIEHIDPPRLEAVGRVLFEYVSPKRVIVTTPNVEYNQVFEMSEGALRHGDHRFEWTRAEFDEWCLTIQKLTHIATRSAR